jgi:hypothetical protein
MGREYFIEIVNLYNMGSDTPGTGDLAGSFWMKESIVTQRGNSFQNVPVPVFNR